MKQGKLLIFTAPSGAGKTTIVRHLLQRFPDRLAFSVSATTRQRRPHELEGKDYYFLSTEEFERRKNAGEFLEWEEVYAQQYYGTLRSEVERLWAEGKHVLFDIDVRGASHIKAAFPQHSLAVFVKPPSAEVLFERLRGRSTEDEASLQKRMARAALELSYENRFDTVLVNDVLPDALARAEGLVQDFLGL